MSLDDHPTVLAVRARPRSDPPHPTVSAAELKQIALQHGADDAGLVEIDRPALDDQRAMIRQVYGDTRALLSFVVGMNREPVRSPVRSVANQEFHATYDAVNETARDIVRALSARQIPACNSVAAFPMEVQLPGRAWMVAHKPVAVAAGLGRIGVHRNVIHPRLGSFVLLGTVLLGVDADAYDPPIDYNPCLHCNLCVAACPVTAIKPDGAFDFMTCYTHNYREFLGNFGEWVGELTEANSAADYRRRVSDGETRSMWQSLSFKPGYKAAYCVAVCPAGEQVIAPFLDDSKDFTERVVRPLRDKPETLYVLPGSDAERDAPRKFPHKALQRVAPSLRPSSIPSYFMLLRLGFQRGRAKALSARYHFRFPGEPHTDMTVHIDHQRLAVEPGHTGDADVSVHVDGPIWLQIVNRELAWRDALARGIVQVTGPLDLLHAFSSCFPGMAELS
jgi:ferredoxin